MGCQLNIPEEPEDAISTTRKLAWRTGATQYESGSMIPGKEHLGYFSRGKNKRTTKNYLG